MGWVALLKGLLSLANGLTQYCANKQLIEAGEAKAIAKGLEEANDAVFKAQRARNSALRSFDASNGSVCEDDPNLRD